MNLKKKRTRLKALVVFMNLYRYHKIVALIYIMLLEYIFKIFQMGQVMVLLYLDKLWKNVVATFYHELIEARTDPDVNHSILGWYCDGKEMPPGSGFNIGGEIGDIPILIAERFANGDISKVFKDVFKDV